MKGREVNFWILSSFLLATASLTYGQYGTSLGMLRKYDHDVKGEIFAVDSTRIFIKGFTYDGKGPDAFFMVGTSGTPSSSGTKVPNEKGSTGVLMAYNNQDLLLTLPDAIPVASMRWFSVYCKQFSVDFGSIEWSTAPANIPATVDLPAISGKTHGVASGTITVLDQQRILIKSFSYDGAGPDAFFLVGKSDSVTGTGAKKVPDENGSTGVLSEYEGKDVILTLPKEHGQWQDFKWLSVYCIQFSENFGDVMLQGLENVPPFMNMDDDELENCETLDDQLNVAWEIDGDDIIIELSGSFESDAGYMAFGVSGSDTRSLMLGGDVAVAGYHNGQAMVKDYYLQAYAFCSGTTGVCADTSFGGTNDCEMLSEKSANGIKTIRYKRPLITGETTYDSTIQIDREMYMIWALGNLNSNGGVTKHTKRTPGDLKLNLGRTAARNCKALKPPASAPVTGWTPEILSGEDASVIKARIGPTGGDKGYNAITGQQSWGIAWYLNGLLIPTFVAKRGVTYTFEVYGGNDDSNPARYHPFYITDDPVGGYEVKSEADKKKVTIFAGEKEGPYCEYMATTATKDPEEYDTFQDYFKTLEISCEQEGEAGTFTWTPDDTTPDTVYYQCYTHQYLGWKIVVVDDYSDFPPMGQASVSRTLSMALLFLTLVTTAVMWRAV